MHKKVIFLLFGTLLIQHLNAQPLSLEDAISTALQNNQKQKISHFEQEIAKAKYQQALSANYPTLDLSLTLNRHDEKFVDETKTSFAIPAGILAPVAVSMPVEYTHDVMGRDTAIARIDAQYALYTGGKISSVQNQAQEGIKYAKEGSKLANDEIIRNVKKYYAATLLSEDLLLLTQETLDRIEAIKDITETFYKGESLSVKKTDYLRVQLMALSVRSILAQMKEKATLAKSALLLELGKDQESAIELTDRRVHTQTIPHDLQTYYETLYLNNHQILQSNIGLKIRDAQIQEVKSEYLPTIALYANAQRLTNNLNGGIINGTNANSWDIGAALKLNIFSGNLTKNKVQEKEIEKLKLEAQQSYLKSALSLQTKNAFTSLSNNLEQVKVLQEAVEIAHENSDLNFRAYQQGITSTKDVVEAQIFESMTKANYYKACYEVAASQAELNYIVGKSF